MEASSNIFTFSESQVKQFLKDKYNLSNIVKIYSLGSYVDCNFYVRNKKTTENQNQNHDSPIFDEYVIKFTSLKQELDQIFFQTAVMKYLNENSQNFKNMLISNKFRGYIQKKTLTIGLIKYINGPNISQIQETPKINQFSQQFLFQSFQQQFGKAIAELSVLLCKIQDGWFSYRQKDIDGKQLSNSKCIWNLTNFCDLKEYLLKIQDEIDPLVLNTVTDLISIFKNNQSIKNNRLKLSITHHDASAENVILTDKYGKHNSRKVKCILDFGDMVYSYSICQLVTAMANISSNDNSAQNLLNKYAKVITGYLQIKHIEQVEWQVIIFLIYARLAQIYLMGHFLTAQKEGNQHLQSATNQSWQLSQILRNHHIIYKNLGRPNTPLFRIPNTIKNQLPIQDHREYRKFGRKKMFVFFAILTTF